MNSFHNGIKRFNQKTKFIDLLVQKSLKGKICPLSKIERKYTDDQVPTWQKRNVFLVEKMATYLIN